MPTSRRARRGSAGKRTAPLAAVAAALVLATVAAYAPVGGFGFVSYDDPEYVSSNVRVARGLSLEGLGWALTSVHHGNWHPATTLSWMLETELFGKGPEARHRVNLALHVANTLLLFWLLAYITGATWRSAVVAALFALHPLHVESVAWISSRKDLLSAGLAFGATLAWASWVRTRRWPSYAAAAGLFAVGLMAKAMLVTWPFVLLLLELWPLRRFRADGASAIDRTELGRAVVDKLPLLALTAGSIALTLWAQREGGALRDTPLYPLDARLANAALAYVAYLWRTLWPFDLAVLYPYPLEVPRWPALGCAALLACVTVLCLRLRRRHPDALVGWLWYLGTLVPVIGLVQVGVQASADRYTYLPLVGIFVALVWALGRLVARHPALRSPAIAIACAVLVLLGVQTRRQVEVWRDSVTLYEHGLRATGRNAVLANNLGIALADLGRDAEAIAAYERGLGFPSPVLHVVHYNAGIAVARTGRHEDALRHFERTLRADPDHGEALYHRAASLEALGRLDEARRDLERVIELVPEEADPHAELGVLLGKLGDLEAAERHLARAVELAPFHVDARINLAVARLKAGDATAAIAGLERALKLAPGHEAAAHYLELARRAAGQRDGPVRSAR